MVVVPRAQSNLPLMPCFMTSASGEDKGDDMAPSTTKQEASRFKKIRQIIFPPKKDADGLKEVELDRIGSENDSLLLQTAWASS